MIARHKGANMHGELHLGASQHQVNKNLVVILVNSHGTAFVLYLEKYLSVLGFVCLFFSSTNRVTTHNNSKTHFFKIRKQ